MFTLNKINLYDLIDFSIKQEVNCLLSDNSYQINLIFHKTEITCCLLIIKMKIN
jgi:hypothetical protein